VIHRKFTRLKSVFLYVVVQSALEELSRKKAQKANPFAKPKLCVCAKYWTFVIINTQCSGAVASKIMSKYGWEEGQGIIRSSFYLW